MIPSVASCCSNSPKFTYDTPTAIAPSMARPARYSASNFSCAVGGCLHDVRTKASTATWIARRFRDMRSPEKILRDAVADRLTDLCFTGAVLSHAEADTAEG